jgi:chromosome segregation ATPase
MPKSSLTRLIEDEEKILDILQINAQASIDDIAKKCGFSRQKVWRIIKKLEEENKALNERIDGLNVKIDGLNKKIESLNNDVTGLKGQIGELEKVISTKEKEIEELKKPKK